ncbi:hypothetical protein [Flexivirga caeni]|uniref:hypothetical protein n=1 Tax=Flexivirga caeni TaxID=2294115 RepID=UPI0011CE4F95|nr:hypothetical protein [Flexivirga caeni]
MIVWRDCSYLFDSSKTLVGIDPGGSGTIDGVKPGSSPVEARAVYGAPESTAKNADGTYSVLYQADSTAKTHYLIVYNGNPAAGATVIKIIYVCACSVPRKTVAKTQVSYVWPSTQDGWTIRQRSDDPCSAVSTGDDGVSSNFATRPDEFSCGIEADSLLVCRYDAGSVTCLVNYEMKDAVRFRSTGPAGRHFAVTAHPQPLRATLSNGQVCNWISHDQTQHYGGRNSWLWCGEFSADPVRALLLKSNGSYFDTSGTLWTAEYDVGTAAPTTVTVKSVVYAQ